MHSHLIQRHPCSNKWLMQDAISFLELANDQQEIEADERIRFSFCHLEFMHQGLLFGGGKGLKSIKSIQKHGSRPRLLSKKLLEPHLPGSRGDDMCHDTESDEELSIKLR